MYAVTNFTTKKALKAAVAEGDVEVYQPGPFPTKAGMACLEGPHYPKPHRWWAEVMVVEKDGRFVVEAGSKVK